MLDARMCEWLNRVGALSDLQGGFRCAHERATVDQIFLLKELVASHRERGVDTYLCFVDVAKAYDTVPCVKTVIVVQLSCVTWVFLQISLRLIRLMYRRVERRVCVNGLGSGKFSSFQGVAQGAVTPPLLYAYYVNALHTWLREQPVGVWLRLRCLLGQSQASS